MLPLKAKFNGPAPDGRTPLTQLQLGAAPAPPGHPLDKQGEEPHATHSFEWCWKDKKRTNLTCDQAETIENVLKRSAQFRDVADKTKNRELVIVRDGKAISSHFPCSLIQEKPLTLRYIKAVNKPKQSSENEDHCRKGPSDEPVMFQVLTKGGRNAQKITKNPALRVDVDEITVYAYKGENVRQALKRDGRLLNTVLKNNFVLSDTSTEVTTEMSNLVDDLDGKTFKIIRLRKSAPSERPPSSLDDAYVIPNESQGSDGNQDLPQQSTMTKPENDTTPEEKPVLKVNTSPERKSNTLQRTVSPQGMKTRRSGPSRIDDFFRVEYGKSPQTCREVKTMKTLMALSPSVCQVRINGTPNGSGFLLFDKFALTNGHVVKDVYNKSTGLLCETVTVHFSFEDLNQMEKEQESRADVEEVAAFEYCSDGPGHEYDWALLKLCNGQNMPDGLLAHFGFLPQSVAICIIGHPDCGVKMMDQCLIVPAHNQNQVVQRHSRENPEIIWIHGRLQSVTDTHFFEGIAESLKQKKDILTYETSFYFGSSGSPVFDEHCNVVAMHSGGYVYNNSQGERQSVIEYGLPLSTIIEQFIFQLVERQRFDVLQKYLACHHKRHQDLMSSLKKLVQGRNLTAFRNAANSSVVQNEESLKKFFEFLCQTEEPVPMDTD